MRIRTFPELVVHRLQTDPGQPLLTAYDGASGERTELSVTTYVNWVSKTANLFTDELGLEAGESVLLDLPPHWLVPVFLGAAWSAGLAVTVDPQVPHSVAVCGPESLIEHRDVEHVLACSLLPFAVRFSKPLPAEVLDYGLLWPGQSDLFVSSEPPSPDTVAWLDAPGHAHTHADLVEEAMAVRREPGVRLVTDANPAADRGVPGFLAPLVAGGSVVLVRHVSEEQLSRIHRDERATDELRARPGAG